MDTVHTGRIIPLHPASQKLSTAVLRRLIKQALDTYGDLPDPLPVLLTERYHVPSHAAALRQIHFPTGLQALKEARRRMIYEELFYPPDRAGHPPQAGARRERQRAPCATRIPR